MARERKMATTRVRRASQVGRVAASQTARTWATRWANVARSSDAADEALERRHIEAAEQLVAVLGTMRGAAMKVGQQLSFLDMGLVPESYREEFQRKLAALRDRAPAVPFKGMRKVIEEDLEEPLSETFAEFDEDPIGSASIGQVYRARLPDGRDVAVKVQYPGIAGAVRADIQNIGLLLRGYKRLMPSLDTKAAAEEIRDRVLEELDYELEASNQRALARAYREHPYIHIPDVVTSLCRERVIVSEYVEGRGFEAIRELDQAERDRVGEIIVRFYLGTSHRLLMFSGDPHPGNCLLRADGTMSFLDFGLFKHWTREAADAELDGFQAASEGDAERLRELFLEHGLLSRRNYSEIEPESLLEQFLDATGWFLLDEEIEVTPAIAARVAMEMQDPRSRHYANMRKQNMPAAHLVGRRVEMLTLAVLGQLRARGNWHRVAREWIYGDEPVTELGRAEQDFWATHRAASRPPVAT
jgi:predicted unusual protein kinase regulating ubiquinone biosynthesis (AarF/ABC1/UbiB family)